jgi:hypothetical protein
VKKSVILIPMVASLLATSVGAATGRQTPGGLVPEVVAKLQPVGRLEGSQRLKLAIGLGPRDEQGLDAFLQELYEPASPNYRHYLTPGEFAERFGPTEQNYKALIDYAKANGFNVTRQYSNRVVLDVEGAVADIEKALHVTMRTYPHPDGTRTFYAPDVEPSLDLGVPVLHIAGLDNYTLPHPRHTHHPLNRRANATPKEGSAPDGQLWGKDFRDAYVPGTTLTGAGQNLGLVEFEGYYASDITDYENAIGMSVNNSPQLVVVPLDGGATPEDGGDNGEECSLDIEMAVAMAPGLSTIYVFEDGSSENGNGPFDDVFESMVSYTNVLQFSCCWGGSTAQDPTSEVLFKQMAAQGQSFFNASGDNGAFVGAVEFPSDSPSITQVGGTTMTDGSAPSYPWESEVVWAPDSGPRVSGFRAESSSGGISTYYAIPSWQTNISMAANMGSTTMRNTPDVAANADNVYLYTDDGQASGGWGGTSCAAPLWAGFTALINQQAATNGAPPVGFLNPALYALASGTNYANCFHDITSGNNTWRASSNQFYAVPGYDLCSGLGTMNGTSLITALLVPPPIFLPRAAGYTLTADEPCGTNAVYPGETVTVNLAVQNVGGAASTSNLVATLLPYLVYRGETAPGVAAPADVIASLLASNETAFPIGPQTIGVLTTNGIATNAFSFFADGTCGQTITAVLQFQDGPADRGTVSYSFQLGLNSDCSNCAATNVPVPTIFFPTNGYQLTTISPVVVVTGLAPVDNANVTIFTNGISNVTVSADGNGVYAALATLNFGSNDLTVTQGATNSSSNVSLIMALGPPTLDVPPVANTNVAISGAGAVGATVQLYEGDSTNGILLTSFVVDASGNFSGTVTLPLGNSALTATETFDGQISTNTAPVSVSVVPVPPPTIISPINGLMANEEAQTISGEGVAGATVTISNIINGVTTNLATTTVNHAGRYSVVVKLADGVNTLFAVQEQNNITSPPSALVVVGDYYFTPEILVPPADQTNFPKGSVTFSAEVAGAAPLKIFWTKRTIGTTNVVKIPGAAGSTYTLSNLKTEDTNYSYGLIASNKYGVATNRGATLTLVTNPFTTELTGAYYGLFAESPAQFESSGLLTLNLTDLGRFTARILSAGGSYSFSGGLSGVGWWSNNVSRGSGKTPLAVLLNLDVTNGMEQILGSVSAGTSWSATLEADRATYSAANPFTNQGKYTLIFGGANNGDGYGTVSASPKGMVSLSGVLPDNTSVAPGAVSVSKDGRWPLYIPLYGRFGSLVGWIDFTNQGASLVDLTNSGVCSFAGYNVMWFRTSADGKLYTNGFTNSLTVIGSAFSPDNNAALLGFPNLEVTLSGGGLPDVLTNSVSPSANGRFTINGGGISGLTLSLNPATGVIRGGFAGPAATRSTPIKGVIFQEQTNAGGFFPGATNSGTFLLTPP